MRQGLAFAILFGVIAFVALLIALWTASIDLTPKLAATAAMFGAAGFVAFFADRPGR